VFACVFVCACVCVCVSVLWLTANDTLTLGIMSVGDSKVV